ncbi:MAG: sigma-70 family RNA polymerase sigma factor [Armatimonadota bacterium]
MAKSTVDPKLVTRAQNGDRKAFGRLFSQYVRLIYSIIRHMVRDDDAAEDLTQDVFVRAWDALPTLNEPKAFSGWLRVIATNITRDYVRARKDTEPLDGDDEDPPRQWADDTPGPAAQVGQQQIQQRVAEAILRLSEHQRVVVTMHHLEQKPVADIAGELDIPVGTVLSRLARGREALRRMLAPYVEGQDDEL